MSHDSHHHHRKGWSEQTINEHSFTSLSFVMFLQSDFLQERSFYYNYKKDPGAGVHLTYRSTSLREVTVSRHTDPIQQRESGVLVAPAPGTTKKTSMVRYSALIALVRITVLMIFC